MLSREEACGGSGFRVPMRGARAEHPQCGASCASKSNIENAVGDNFEYNMAFFPGEEELNVCIGGNGLAIFASSEAEHAVTIFCTSELPATCKPL